MEFDTSKFAEEFKETINWMLRNAHSKKIKDDFQFFIDNKDELGKNPNSLKALRMIVELIVTNGWRLKKPLDFDSKMDSFIRDHGGNFRTSEAKNKLIELVGNRRKKNIEHLLEYPTIKDFTEDLYNLAKEGKTKVLGEKGRDNYLRDFGYWDRVPIDIHEMRFILRSGIYHSCSSKDRSDPLEKTHFQDILTRFCKEHLKGFKVKIKKKDGSFKEIDLRESPGIVDIFIWSYCAEDRYKICIKKPQCEICKLKGVCLYAITNSP